MREIQPNSHRYKEEQKSTTPEKRVNKVVTNDVKVRKKSGVQKFADVFISEDISNVKSYIFRDVLVPAIKKAISDIVNEGLDMALYGGTGGGSKRSSGSRGSFISYEKCADRRDDRRYVGGDSRGGVNFDQIVFRSRGKAEETLLEMRMMLEQYPAVRVSDLYDMVEMTAPFTANNYGWTNLRNAEVVRAGSEGYIIKLPKPFPID